MSSRQQKSAKNGREIDLSIEPNSILVILRFDDGHSSGQKNVCGWFFKETMQVTVSVAILRLEDSAAHMHVIVSVANMWVAIFIVIMQIEVSVAIMLVVFSAVHYAYDCFYCNYPGDSFFMAM